MTVGAVIGWTILALYVVGYIAFWRTVVWAVISDFAYGPKPEGEDLIVGTIVGSCLNLFWPLIALGLVVRSAYRRRGQEATFAVMPRHVRREQELQQREQRIARLERDLNIGQNV